MKKIFLIGLFLIGLYSQGQTPAFKNTALEYCKGLGYTIVEDPLTKSKLCILPNGEKVNPWDFFQGVVGKEFSYCTKAGYNLRIKEVKKGRTVHRYPICDAKGKPSKTLMALLYEDNNFASLFENQSTTLIPDTIAKPSISKTNPPPQTDALPPTSFNWNSYNNHDWDRSPEDQGPYGICYAMAAASVAETVWNFHHDLPVDQGNSKNFSQAFIAFFGSYTYPQNPYEWWAIRGTWGLKIGYEGVPLQKLCTNGIIEESEFPWDHDNLDTIYTYSPCERYRFTDFVKCNASVTDMKRAIIGNGPLLTTMIYDSDIHLYYYNQVLYENYVECGEEHPQNHVVVIVGWDYNEDDGEYWIVKNSYGNWGSGGANGYMKIATDNAYGINCDAYHLRYSPIQINGEDLAYEQQSITSIPSGNRSINHKPEPYSSFNGFANNNVWATGSTANLDPKDIDGLEAIVKFRVVYGQQNGYRLDPDSVGYYQKYIWAGKPKTPTISGPTTLQCETPAWFYGDGASTNGLNTAETYEWNFTSGLEALTILDNPPSIRLGRLSGYSHTITLTATNNCGNVESSDHDISVVACDTIWGRVYPNPVSDEINIDVQANMEVSAEIEIELLDANAIKRKQMKTKEHFIRLNVNDLREGSYLLKLKAKVDGKIIHEKNFSIIIAR